MTCARWYRQNAAAEKWQCPRTVPSSETSKTSAVSEMIETSTSGPNSAVNACPRASELRLHVHHVFARIDTVARTADSISPVSSWRRAEALQHSSWQVSGLLQHKQNADIYLPRPKYLAKRSAAPTGTKNELSLILGAV